MAVGERTGLSGYGTVGMVVATIGSHGELCQGETLTGWERSGKAVSECIGSLRTGIARIGLAVLDRSVRQWLRSLGYGLAVRVRTVSEWYGAERKVSDLSLRTQPERNTMTIKEKLAYVKAEQKRNEEHFFKWKNEMRETSDGSGVQPSGRHQTVRPVEDARVAGKVQVVSGAST